MSDKITYKDNGCYITALIDDEEIFFVNYDGVLCVSGSQCMPGDIEFAKLHIEAYQTAIKMAEEAYQKNLKILHQKDLEFLRETSES